MSTGGVTYSWPGGTRVSDGLANRSSIRRSLFGPVDHDSNRRFVQEELDRIQERAKKKWNFDFQTETPLKGRFEWMPVYGQEAALCEAERMDCEETTRESIPKQGDARLTNATPTSLGHCGKQPHITDYMRKRKTLCPVKSDPVSSPHNTRRQSTS